MTAGDSRHRRGTRWLASGNGKGQIFVRGEVIKTVPESQIVARPGRWERDGDGGRMTAAHVPAVMAG